MPAKFATRMEHMKASEIRELLKITEKPEVISFAGGLPAPELFPIEEMKTVSLKVLEDEGQQALQYATTEGFKPLREKIAQRMNRKFNTAVEADDIIITSGSQQGLDITGKVFLDEGDVVLCESPSYLGAINAFKAYKPAFIGVPTDDEGMVIGKLEEILSCTPEVKLIYVIPDFQNPTGRSWSVDRRAAFMELVSRYDVMVIEDNPYGELRFDGEIPPSLKAFDKKGQVVFLGSFSKIFCPGYRIAWVAAEKSVLDKYVLVKQGADLQSSTIGQREVSMFMDMYCLDTHVEKIKKVYKKRRDLIISSMKEMLPGNIKFTYPMGGLFIWMELPEGIDAKALLEKSLESNVAFVPGESFFPDGGKSNTLRLNYSNMPEERIVEGIRRLAKVLSNFAR